jgi:feruloyl esterase
VDLIKNLISALVLMLFISILTACEASKDSPPNQENPTVQTTPVCTVESIPSLPDVRITSVTQEAVPAPHCKVAGVIGTEIRFELLLPDEWNGKFAMGGGGGFVGMVINSAQLYFGAVQSGYATVGTDAGHQGHPLDGSWALNNADRLVNFGHVAVHRTAVTAKALTEAYYGNDIERSYFTGCSTGGRQALMEAQRYPGDFDGIVSGAPPFDYTALVGAGMSQITHAMYPDPTNLETAVIGPEEQELIASRIFGICDALDGLEDGILNDPRQCEFDIKSLACEASNTQGCLTEDQVRAAQAIYEGPKDSHGSLFPGYPFGGERAPAGWSRWLTGGLKYAAGGEFQEGVEAEFAAPILPSTAFGFGPDLMKYLVYNDPDWNYAEYNWDTFREDTKLAAATLNPSSPELSAFRKRGGKLLIYNGWADMAVTAYGTIKYFESVMAQDVSASEDARLFLLPGVDHCTGGVGPFVVNHLQVIDEWVTTGNAPEEMPVYWIDENRQLAGSRLLCAYPQVAEYDGQGDPRDSSSFSCVGTD